MSPEGKIELKQLYLKGLSDAKKSCLEDDFGGSPRDENHEIARAQFSFKFLTDIDNYRGYKGSTYWPSVVEPFKTMHLARASHGLPRPPASSRDGLDRAHVAPPLAGHQKVSETYTFFLIVPGHFSSSQIS